MEIPVVSDSRPHRSLGERTPTEFRLSNRFERRFAGLTSCRKLTLKVLQEKGTAHKSLW